MSNSWLRLWHDMPNDPKWRTIARISGQPISLVQAVYLHMLVDASRNVTRGHVDVTAEDIASALDVTDQQILDIFEAMDGRVIEDGKLSGWDKRQPKKEDQGDPQTGAKSALERKREQRKRQREAEQVTHGHDMSRNVTLDKDKDKDKEKNKDSLSKSLSHESRHVTQCHDEGEQPDTESSENLTSQKPALPIKTPAPPGDREAGVLWQRYTEIQAIYPGAVNSNHDFQALQNLSRDGLLPDQGILLERAKYQQTRLDRGYVTESRFIPSLKKWLAERQWETVYPEEKELQRVMNRPAIDWDSEEMNQPF